MPKTSTQQTERALSARERQIMDVLWKRGEATVSEVRAELPSPPGYSAVRAMLRILEEKGHLRHREDGRRYVYSPRAPRHSAERSALQSLVRTFYSDSPSAAVAALLDLEAGSLTTDELDQLEELIRRARANQE